MKNGTKVLAIREVVKLNHHRNCLLCHAPATTDTDRNLLRSGLVARVPSPDDELPPSNSRVYYAFSRGEEPPDLDGHLRQDFTVIQSQTRQVAEDAAFPTSWSERTALGRRSQAAGIGF